MTKLVGNAVSTGPITAPVLARRGGKRRVTARGRGWRHGAGQRASRSVPGDAAAGEAIKWFKVWLTSHGRQIAAAVALIAGGYMVISGLVRLS